ncbi:MAG: dTDP-4-dehydrorhamnose reductase [Acidobacteria bacterium]|nr:MAG: dTDP-4-dehydrorhamnose reductase [Acidobacteriota bacterium]
MSNSGILIIGSTGMLGRELAAECARRGTDCRNLVGPDDLDVTQAAAVSETLRREMPAVVINATAYTDVDGAEANRAEADLVNGAGPGNLARVCRELDCMLVHFSTDYVFDGRAGRPYLVDDEPDPINAYGRSKLLGDRAIAEAGCRHLLIRTSWLFAAHGHNFVRTILRLAGRQPTLNVIDDQHGRPTYCPDLARMTFDLVDRGAQGTWHAANDGHCTWFDFATAIVGQAGSACEVRRCPTTDHPRPAPRPAFSVLDLSATTALIGCSRHWSDAVADCVGQLTDQPVTEPR